MLVEGVNHDLVCAGSNYHVHFAWQVWHGQYSPGFKFNKLKSFARVKIDRTHVDLKDSRGKGFALRRLTVGLEPTTTRLRALRPTD